MLILASRSPARKALLAGAGLAFEARDPDVNERLIEANLAGESAETVARRLAEAKARGIGGDDAVIGADQVLALGEERLHKPPSLAAAREQLLRLRGRTHVLHAGVALAVGGEVVWSTTESAALTMREFSEAELDGVLALEGNATLGSVGGYRLEGPSVQLFQRIEGDYFTILGLPLLQLLAALRRHVPLVLAGSRGFT